MGRDPILLESSSEQEIWTQWMHIHGKKKKKNVKMEGEEGHLQTKERRRKQTIFYDGSSSKLVQLQIATS